MLMLAIILFLLAAVFGLIILTAILQERPTNKIAKYLHGAVALSAVALLIADITMYGASRLLIISLVLFIGAALGGLTLFMLDLKQKKVPKLLATLHPIVAVSALIVLIIDVLP